MFMWNFHLVHSLGISLQSSWKRCTDRSTRSSKMSTWSSRSMFRNKPQSNEMFPFRSRWPPILCKSVVTVDVAHDVSVFLCVIHCITAVHRQPSGGAIDLPSLSLSFGIERLGFCVTTTLTHSTGSIEWFRRTVYSFSSIWRVKPGSSYPAMIGGCPSIQLLSTSICLKAFYGFCDGV